jgi:excisionase family DNA binding protein
MERLLTAEEACGVLGITRARLYFLVRTAALPAVRLRRQVRFSPAALQRFIERGGTITDHEPVPAA